MDENTNAPVHPIEEKEEEIFLGWWTLPSQRVTPQAGWGVFVLR